MNPTQFELATLAATLTSTATPGERVNAALAIWNAAGAALRPPQAPPQGFDDHRDLGELLAELLPSKGSSDRLKLWRDFLPVFEAVQDERTRALAQAQAARVGGFIVAPEVCAADLAQRAEETMTRHRTLGVRDAAACAAGFTAWNSAREADNRAARAKKGADSRHSGKNHLETEKPSRKVRKQPTAGRKQND